jgi:predicted metal-dependent hydrolase
MKRKSSAPTQRQLRVGAKTVTYTLTLAPRKSIGITVRPDLRVDVRAPHGLSIESVEEILRKRATWILRHLQAFAARPTRQVAADTAVRGTYRYLGRDLPLRIEELSRKDTARAGREQEREEVTLDEGTIWVWVKRNDEPKITALLEMWLRVQAQLYFSQRLQQHFDSFQTLGVQPPTLVIRRMRARWGSCSSTGKVTLNLKLMHMDEALIDYVIVHELCHLVEHNHSPRFYALLTRMMPDWKQRRQQLNEQGMPE